MKLADQDSKMALHTETGYLKWGEGVQREWAFLRVGIIFLEGRDDEIRLEQIEC